MPIVGVAVDDWSVKDLREHARKAIVDLGRARSLTRGLQAPGQALLLRPGDFADDATYGRVADEVKGAKHPVFYLEIPPSLFGMTIDGLAGAGLTKDARVVVEKPFGHDRESATRWPPRSTSTSTRTSSTGSTTSSARWGWRSCSSFRRRDDRADLEPPPRRLRPDHDGGGLRSRPRGFYDPVGAVPTWSSTSCAGGRGLRHRAPAGAPPDRSRTRCSPLFESMPPARYQAYVRGARGLQEGQGIAKDSTTRPRCDPPRDREPALERVPFFIRTGKLLPMTQTEVRLHLRAARQARVSAPASRPEPDELIVSSTPHRDPLQLNAQRPGHQRGDQPGHGVRGAGR